MKETKRLAYVIRGWKVTREVEPVPGWKAMEKLTGRTVKGRTFDEVRTLVTRGVPLDPD